MMVVRIFLDKPFQVCKEGLRKCWTASAFNIEHSPFFRFYNTKASCVSVPIGRHRYFYPQYGQSLETAVFSRPVHISAVQLMSRLQFSRGWGQNSFPLLDSNAVHSLSLQHLSPATTSVRYKSKRKKGKESESESDSDEDDVLDEDDFDAPTTFKIMKIHVASMRADAVISNSLDISRNRLEELFFGTGFLLNGTRMLKKSSKMEEGDCVDVVMEKTDSLLRVKRVKLLKIFPQKTSTDKFLIKVRVWKAPFILDSRDT